MNTKKLNEKVTGHCRKVRVQTIEHVYSRSAYLAGGEAFFKLGEVEENVFFKKDEEGGRSIFSRQHLLHTEQ